MEYSDIIKKNIELASVHWWPECAYHFTDVTNAVNILSTEFLFSRNEAKSNNMMINDNASKQVINMTTSGVTARVRFYFRPLTPTQYYVEGYKHPALRYGDDQNANIPVPVFFAFDMMKLISDENITFSIYSQAGRGDAVLSGINAFSKLPFNNVYSNDYTEDETIRKCRHAEILYNGKYNINKSIRAILCRNEIEKLTLLNLLYDKNKQAYYKYKDRIKVCKRDMFEYNGLYLTDVNYADNKLLFKFSDTYEKMKYENKQKEKNCISSLDPIAIKAKLIWEDSKGIILEDEANGLFDYERIKSLKLEEIPIVEKAKLLKLKVYIEEKLIAYIKYPLDVNVLM